MANIQLTRACGHVEAYREIGHNRAAKDARNQWEERRVCGACYTARVAEGRAEATGDAALEARDRGLPLLTGTEKQVAWALRLRQSLLGQLDAAAQTLRQKKTEAVDETALEIESLSRVEALIHEETSAKFWIDHRALVLRDFEASLLYRVLHPDAPLGTGYNLFVIKKALLASRASEVTPSAPYGAA